MFMQLQAPVKQDPVKQDPQNKTIKLTKARIYNHERHKKKQMLIHKDI